jgi:hypothetical protein
VIGSTEEVFPPQEHRKVLTLKRKEKAV